MLCVHLNSICRAQIKGGERQQIRKDKFTYPQRMSDINKSKGKVNPCGVVCCFWESLLSYWRRDYRKQFHLMTWSVFSSTVYGEMSKMLQEGYRPMGHFELVLLLVMLFLCHLWLSSFCAVLFLFPSPSSTFYTSPSLSSSYFLFLSHCWHLHIYSSVWKKKFLVPSVSASLFTLHFPQMTRTQNSDKSKLLLPSFLVYVPRVNLKWPYLGGGQVQWLPLRPLRLPAHVRADTLQSTLFFKFPVKTSGLWVRCTSNSQTREPSFNCCSLPPWPPFHFCFH